MLTVQRLQNWNKKVNNSESFLLLLKNLLKCTYEVLLPSQRDEMSNIGDHDQTAALGAI